MEKFLDMYEHCLVKKRSVNKESIGELPGYHTGLLYIRASLQVSLRSQLNRLGTGHYNVHVSWETLLSSEINTH